MNVDLERTAKAFPLTVAAIYVLGFLVVAFHLAKYGTSSLELFKIQYLAAGFWCGLTFALYFAALASVRLVWQLSFEVRGSTPPEKRGRIGVLWSSALLNGVLILMVVGSRSVGSYFSSRDHGRALPSRPVLLLLFGLAALDVTLGFLRENIPWHRSLSWRLQGLILFPLIMNCIFQFSDAVYPHITFSFGGGLPRSVVFVLNEGTDATSSFLVRDGAGPRTIPYQLLLENENSFVVVSPKAGEKAIEFDRKSVAAMIVLESPKEP